MEVWKDVPGFEGLYVASNTGGLIRMPYRGAKRNRWGNIIDFTMSERAVKPKPNNRGYLQVRLYKDSVCFNMLLHRVVAMAFIPNPQNLPQINHIDEDKTNNNISNLEWCTNMYNRHHGTGIERMAKNHDYSKISARLSIPVLQIHSDGSVIKRWPSIASAAKHYHVNAVHITQTCKGTRKLAKGYRWQYAS